MQQGDRKTKEKQKSKNCRVTDMYSHEEGCASVVSQQRQRQQCKQQVTVVQLA